MVVDAENSDNDLHPVEVHDLELDLSTHSPVKKKHETHQQQHNTKGNTGDKRDELHLELKWMLVTTVLRWAAAPTGIRMFNSHATTVHQMHFIATLP